MEWCAALFDFLRGRWNAVKSRNERFLHSPNVVTRGVGRLLTCVWRCITSFFMIELLSLLRLLFGFNEANPPFDHFGEPFCTA